MNHPNLYPNELLGVSSLDSFGMLMRERTYSSATYRFGFNGQEKDDEVAGSGNINSAKFWEYDCRIGKRFNIDPVLKSWESPYAAFRNSPIRIIDPNGDDGYVDENGNYLGDDGDKNSHNVRVIAKDRWDEIVKKDELESKRQGKTVYKDGQSISEGDRKKLQSDIEVQDAAGDEKSPHKSGLVEVPINNKEIEDAKKNGKIVPPSILGQSKLLTNYEKGIKISDDAWANLKKIGCERVTAYVTNNSDKTAYYKPDGRSIGGKDSNPFARPNEAIKIEPGQSIYSPIDGLATEKYNNKVFKISDDVQGVIILKGGEVINGEVWYAPDGWREATDFDKNDNGWANLFWRASNINK